MRHLTVPAARSKCTSGKRFQSQQRGERLAHPGIFARGAGTAGTSPSVTHLGTHTTTQSLDEAVFLFVLLVPMLTPPVANAIPRVHVTCATFDQFETICCELVQPSRSSTQLFLSSECRGTYVHVCNPNASEYRVHLCAKTPVGSHGRRLELWPMLSPAWSNFLREKKKND